MALRCKRCGSAERIKNGFMRGKQRYRCQACGLNYTVEVSTRSDGRLELAVGDQAEAVARAWSPICFSRAVGAASRKVCIGVLP